MKSQVNQSKQIESRLSDDCIQVVMSFLSPHELLNAAAVSKRWASLSSQDHLWRTHVAQASVQVPSYSIRKRKHSGGMLMIADRAVGHAARDKFLELLKMEATDKSIKRKIDNVETAKKIFQISYVAVLPFLFFIGLCLCSILIPLNLSENPAHSYMFWYNPFLFISLPCYTLILLSVFLDPFVLNYIQKKYHSSLGTQSVYAGDFDFVKSMNLFVWSFSWIPLAITCMFLKLHVWPNMTWLDYRAALSPVFFTCATLILVPPVIWIYKYNRGKLPLRENRAVFTVYIWSTIVNIFIVIQFGLIAGKLDGTIPATWGGVFTPTWLLFTVIILACPFTCVMTVTSNSDFFAGLSVGSCIMCSAVLPLIIFMVLLSLRLDLSISIQWGLLFVPLYIFEIFVTLFALLLGGNALKSIIEEGIPL